MVIVLFVVGRVVIFWVDFEVLLTVVTVDFSGVTVLFVVGGAVDFDVLLTVVTVDFGGVTVLFVVGGAVVPFVDFVVTVCGTVDGTVGGSLDGSVGDDV